MISTTENSILAKVGQHAFPKEMLGFTSASAFIIAIAGTIGNLLTIIALPMNKKLRTTATAFVINLAVVELSFCLFILVPSGAQYAYLQYYEESIFSDVQCIFFAGARYTFTQVELQTILAIAVTRAIAIGCPSFYKKIDNSMVTGIYIAAIWIYAFSLRLPIMIGVFGSYVFNNRTMECDMNSDAISRYSRLISLIVEAIVPVLVIIFLYAFIFIMVKRSSMRVAKNRQKATKPTAPIQEISTNSMPNEDPSDLESDQRRKSSTIQNLKRILTDSTLKARLYRRSSSHSMKSSRDMRVARSIFIIFLLFLICSLPVIVIHVIDSQTKQPRRFLVVHILYWLQYCLNMCVYVLMNRQYRIAYVELLSKILPSFERHKTFVFPWENVSVSSKPNIGQNSSFKSRQDSLKKDKQNNSYEYKPIEVVIHKKRERLSVISEINSLSAAEKEGLVNDDSESDCLRTSENLENSLELNEHLKTIPESSRTIPEGSQNKCRITWNDNININEISEQKT